MRSRVERTLNFRPGMGILIASVLFTCLSGGVVAQTQQTDLSASRFEAQPPIMPPGATQDPRQMRLLSQKAAAALANGVAPKGEASAQATSALHFMSFDAPGAVNTYPFAINDLGTIVGYFSDINTAFHGFLRSPDGRFSTFDAPGAGTGTYQGTFPQAISDLGVVTGSYTDGNSASHGFVRDFEDRFTSFDVPGDVNGTFPSGINLAGTVTGSSYDANLVSHGFVRSPRGEVSTFDVPGVGTGSILLGTYATAINPAGTVSGCYSDVSGVFYGFIREADGTVTPFNVPGPLFPNCSGGFTGNSGGFGISPAGATTGNYFQPIEGNPFTGNYRGYLRFPNASYIGFDAVPNPNSPCCTWTWGIAINAWGAITGTDNDAYNINHGFVRASDGTVTILDAPGAGTGLGQGTFPDSINLFGLLTGWYTDSARVRHGFLWTP